MANFYGKLNQQQEQAVTAGPGQVLVLAGPGSGKTRVLTYRIAHLVGTLNVYPSHILAVTFTNKAAREMQNRLGLMLGPSAEGLWLGTFHGMCARILRREADLLPFKTNFVIMDADDQQSMIRRIIKDLNLNDKLFKASSIHAAISTAKNEMFTPDSLPSRNYRDEVVGRVYRRYQEMLQENNAVDFDDLLLWAVRLFQENPQAREKYAAKFEHVLVDEFQDTNQVQYELLNLVSSHWHNIFVVGDEDQSIYRWRGADYRNVLRFERENPGCTKILLEQNYRSTQTVLDAARSVIDLNRHRTPKKLTSARGEEGERILLHEAADDHAEAAFVVDTIIQQVKAGKAKPGDFALMYRTNAQSRLLEEGFLRSGMAYRLVGAQRFYGRREVKDIISYLRLAQNPDDEISLLRAIGVPPRGIGDKTLVSLQLAARQSRMTPGSLLMDLGSGGKESGAYAMLSGRGAALLADFGAMLAGWSQAALQAPLPELFERILVETGYHEYIDDGSEEGIDRWANVQELRRLAYEYSSQGLTQFLETIALVSDQDTLPEQNDVPTLLTLHAAKGLEFSHVFIVGLDEGLLPHSRSLDEPEEMAEERRLFYVGITRAKNQLYLVRSAQRSTYGSYEISVPSRFLDNIPGNLLRGQGLVRTNRQPASSQAYQNTRWQLPDPPYHARKSAPIIEARFRPTMSVSHAVYGEGIVLESRLEDGDETVTVEFKSVGIKKLLASLANLQILPG